MAYKFRRGDTVRVAGNPTDMIVTHTDDGTRYMLAQHANDIAPQKSATEDELELVKRASDDETGLKLWYVT
jgi:hypothetical protein